MKIFCSLLFVLFVLNFHIYAQQAISYGETITESISSDGEVDVYTFSGVANEKVIIRLTENSSSYPLEPSLELYNPTGNPVESTSDGSQAEINIVLPQTGTYTIFASDVNGDDTGNYALFIQRVMNPGNASIINYGETLTGSISTDGEVDTYSFAGNAGDKIIVRLTENSSSYPLEPLAEVFDPAGDSLLASIDGAQAQMEITLPADGSYMILVSDSYPGDDTGNYALFIQRVIDPGNASIINYGETLTGSISTDGDVDTYSFTGNAGDKIIVRLTENSSSYPLEPLVELFNPAGDSLIAGIDGAQAQMEITLPADGSYMILVSDSYPGDATGNYSLFIQRMVEPGNITRIKFGETLTGSISADGEVDTYVFLGGPGDSIIIRLTENSSSYPLEPFVELFDPSGDLVLSASDGAQAEIGIRINDVGYYTILASDSYPGDDTGNYTIFLYGFMASQILALPDLIEFGDVIISHTANDNFVLFNRGLSAVTNSMNINGDNQANFNVSPSFSNLDAGDSQFVSVEFTPDAIDTIRASILITSTGGEAVVTLKGNGIADPTYIEDHLGLNTIKSFLYPNYPNPFNPTTKIKYSIPTANRVNIKVSDILGREVAILVDEYKNAGLHSVEFDGSHFASGVYFYRIQSGSYTQIRKMVLMK